MSHEKVGSRTIVAAAIGIAVSAAPSELAQSRVRAKNK
jgi:hypothetical protein